jgi:prepilin-type N-terminal cleavage/methylation domain-containing protein
MSHPVEAVKIDGAEPHGFTLVELLIGIAVMSIAFFSMFAFFISQHKVDATNQRNFKQQQLAMFLLDTLVKDIRRAGYMHKGSGSGADQDIKIAESKRIKFYVGDTSSVTYLYNSTTDNITQYNDTYPSGRVIYDELNITTLSFRYFNSSGSTISFPISTSTTLKSIRRVDIYLEVQPDSSASASLGLTTGTPFQASVRPRNLGLYEE